MTVDMLAATFFWPEGTLLHVREDIAPDGESGSRLTEQAADPSTEPPGETFWAAPDRMAASEARDTVLSESAPRGSESWISDASHASSASCIGKR